VPIMSLSTRVVPEAAIKPSNGFLLRPAHSQLNFPWFGLTMSMNANVAITGGNFYQNNRYVDAPGTRIVLQ